MKFLFVFFLTLASSGLALSQPQKKCFVNGGLKDESRVYLTINGTQISGEFVIERAYDPANREIYVFNGTRKGDNLTIKFPEGKIPDALPRNPENFIWTLITTPGRESLQIKFFGKNYNTNKNEAYTAEFESCEPSYAALAKTARRIVFAKGTSSASVSVALKANTERRTFLLNLGKGQTAAVQAAGCGISFYYPDKTQYEEGTAIDNWNSQALAQSGDYLFVISAAGFPGTCNVTFNAK